MTQDTQEGRNHKFLLSLLNDDDDNSASLAMSALLAEEDQSRLEEELRRLQETSDAKLRKRIHQLQSTIALRARRTELNAVLKDPSKVPSLLEGLLKVHLLWFDNDSPETLKRQWGRLLSSSKKYAPDTLEEVAAFLRKRKFRCVHKDELDPENFCLGSVLDDRMGADFMLCSLAVMLFRAWNKKENYDIFITQSAEKDFILVDSLGNIAVPANDWDFIPFEQNYRFEFWDTGAILRYAVMLLFACASSTDSFRYVFTAGSCLSDQSAEDPVSRLPYPYGTRSGHR